MVYKHLELWVSQGSEVEREPVESPYIAAASKVLENSGVIAALQLDNADCRYELITLEIALALSRAASPSEPTITVAIEELKSRITAIKRKIKLDETDKKILEKELKGLINYCLNRAKEFHGYYIPAKNARKNERKHLDISLIAPYFSLKVKYESDPNGVAFAIEPHHPTTVTVEQP